MRAPVIEQMSDYCDMKRLFFYLSTNFSTISVSASAIPTKWSNTLKQFVGKFPTNCLSVFDRFVGLALKGLTFNYFLYLCKIITDKKRRKDGS